MRYFLRCLLAACLALGMSTSAHAELDENGIEPNSWVKFDEKPIGTISSSTTFANSGSNTATWTVTDGSIVSSGGTGKGWTMGGNAYQTNMTKNNSVHTTTYIVRVSFGGQTFSGEKVVFAANGKAYGGPALTVTGGGSSDYTVRVRKHVQGSSTEGISCTISKGSDYHWFAITTSGATMNSTSLYVDGALIGSLSPSENWYSGQNNYYVFGKWGGNGGNAVPTGIIYDDVRSYEQVLTAAQIKNICTSERVWGNAGSASEKGVATSSNGGGYTTFNIDFGQADNISQTGIGSAGTVCIKKIRLFRRAKSTANPPSKITISQTGATSVNSKSVTLTTGVKVYGANWPTTTTDFYSTDAFDAVFDATTEFDTSKPLTITFPSAQLFMIQPANSVMQVSGWSPAIEITGVYTEDTDPKTYTAALDGTKKWSELEWSPALPTSIRGIDKLVINVSGTTPTLLMDTAYSTRGSVTFNGGAVVVGADDALYEDGCWQKDILSAGSIAAASGLTFPAIKEGFSGAYSKSDTAITLRAQNKEVISINFAGGLNSEGYSPTDYIVKGTGYAGLAPVQSDTWVNLTNRWNGRVTKNIPPIVATKDGVTKIDRSAITGTCTAQNTYRWDGATDVFLKGYLDDGGQNNIVVDNIPYSSYDVIVYAATDEASKKFAAVTLNGTQYTNDSANPTTAKAGGEQWGASRNTTAVYGTNAIRIRNIQSSSLAIVGGANANGARGCIAAIQIVCTGTIEEKHDYTATISSSTNFGAIQWKEGTLVEGVLTTATITIDDTSTDEVAITFENPAIVLKSLTIISKRDVRLVASAGLVNVASIDVSKCTGKVTYAMPVSTLATSDKNIAYAGGTTEGVRVGIAYGAAGTWLSLVGGTYELTETHGDNETTVTVTDSVLNYGDAIALGKGATVVGGNSKVNAVRFILVQGQGNNCSFTLKDAATVDVSGKVIDDSNKNDVMFGHWAGNSTFTIQDSAVYAATNTQVLVGKTGGDHILNIAGGVFKTKGIKASSSATGTNTLNLNGGELILGEVGITSYGATTIAVHVGGDAKITSFAETRITQPVTIDAGKTLTVDATAGDVVVSGPVANNGTIKVVGGNLVFVGVENPGTYVTEGTGKVLFGYTVTINNCGKFRIPEGKQWNEILLYEESGKKVTITKHDANYVYFDWKITGDACWWDYEFEGNVNNAGTDGVPLSWDGGRPYKGNEYATDEETGDMSLHIPSRPWRDVGSWPEVATFVMYGTMVNKDKTYQICFGSRNSKGIQLFVATRSVADGTVDLCLSEAGAAPTILCTMTVPNAQSANHLYVFVLKTVEGNSVINTYLDGELLQPYTHKGTITLGKGFQIASGHGDPAEGYGRPNDDDPALMDWLRVYDLELNHEAMVEYAKRYPYEPANGSYRRAATSATELWDKDKAWRKSGTSMVTNTPAVGAMVIIDTDSEISLDVNLSEDATYGAIEISGNGSLTIGHVPGYAGKVRSSGRVTVGANTTFSHAAFDMAGAPLTVEDGCTVTFDMSDVELDVWSPVAYDLTGLVTAGEDAKLVCTCGEVPKGRSVRYGIDPADQHFKFHVDVAGTLVAEVTEDTTFDALEWTVNGEAVQPNFEKTVYATISNRADGATLTFDSNLDSRDSVLTFGGDKALNLAANEGVSVAGVSYDFRELDAKATFAFNPDPSKVQAGYVRYDLDMGTYLYDAVLMTPGGRYEFKKIRIDGHGYDYHDRTVIVQPDDYLNLHDGTELGCGLSLDVRGGEVYMGTMIGTAYIAYGRNGTRFNQSGGIVTVNANGTEQTGLNGFVLSHSADGGGIHAFDITGGIFTVPNSSICFNQPTNTINVSGAGVLRAKGAFFSGKEGASAGVINVSGEGVLEVGSLGVTADACTLNLNGGILRGYEAGASFKSRVVQNGATTVASTEGADLTMGGTFTGSSAITVSEGTVKLGKASALGTGALTVASGATFDLNGFAPGNAITISGSGANGAGALANTGGEATLSTVLTLAADAVLGGTGTIKQADSSNIHLDGRTLTISGNGVVYMLGAGTVQGGGRIVAGNRGTLASNGATALGKDWDCDLAVDAGGTLDMTHGSHISCRDFTNAGTITSEGDGATLIVHGTLDASAATTLPKLTLYDNATLKGGASGIQLVLTTTGLTLGARLNVNVVNAGSNIKLATVPENTPIKPSETTLIVNGGVPGAYALELQGTSLLATSGGGNYAEVALSSVLPWTNFESLKIDGSLANLRVITTGTTNIDVLVTYESGVVTTQRFVYAGGPDGKFSYVVNAVSPGERYDVSAYVLIDTVSISEESTNVYAMTARTLDQWIAEDYQTFGGKRIGTGRWDDISGIAAVKGEAIAFAAKARDQLLTFTSTNRAQIAELGALKEIRISETFTAAAIPPALPSSEGLVAVAMTTNALGQCQFAVATNGGWQVTARTTFAPELNTAYEIVVRIDENARTVAYGVVKDKAIVWLGDGAYLPNKGCVQIVFTGAGKITKIDGQCHDANLMQVMVGDVPVEYATVEDALAAAGETGAIAPLWWSNYKVTGERGSFRVVGQKGYFEPIFAKWYHYEKTSGPKEDEYRYVAANNWIEYSDASGVEQTGNGAYRVMTEPGLAWIAEQAANGTFEGTVTLGADLDLSSKNWTPIANFTGSFDGQGRVIAGLNNTNVVVDPLLGEAGHYHGGITNAWDYTAYGLFGCTKDAAFRNITLRDVAISNTADSVAALVGVHAGGDLTVENVTTEEGVVRGEGAVVAGLVTIGGEGEDIGKVVVTNNANCARVVGGEGANLAQVLAGTTWETLFEGTVDATGNAGQKVPVSLYLDMPICNFGAAIDLYDEQMDYWRYVEANAKDSVPIDPVNRTARMLAGYFDNGETNYLGRVMDAITASGNGATLALPETGATLDGWSTIFVDRNLTLDLNGNALYGVYDCDVFNLANGVAFTIRNGTVYSVENYQAFAGDTTGLTQENITLVELKGSFYERTVPPSSLDVSDKKVRIVVPHSSELFTYTLESTASLADEWAEEETQFGTGSALTFEVPATGEQRFYRIRMGE